MENVNPAVKKGDKIILIESKNSSTDFVGKVLEVTTQRTRRTKTNFTVRDNETGKVRTVYTTQPKDKYIMASREAEINYLDSVNTKLLAEVEENKVRINFLKKYETEEDFVAEKLESILTAHNKAGGKKARTNAIASILKELKQSDIL